MRVGIDIQVLAEGNRSGLFNAMRLLIGALQPLFPGGIRLFASASRHVARRDTAQLSRELNGTPVTVLARLSDTGLRSAFSPLRSIDVLVHNLHGRFRPSPRCANVYIVPDIIPTAFDYGVPNFADAYGAYYEAAARYGDTIVVSSEHTRQDFLARIGGTPDTITVAPLAADPIYRPASDRQKLERDLTVLGVGDRPYVLMVATLERRKNHAVLLRAFARLLERDSTIRHRLVLVGGTWIGHEEVFDLISELNLGDRVKYLGFSDHLDTLYAGADAFVFPSLYEGFGLPPLEAMAAGVPVLAADATSLPEVVGSAGHLFDPHDPDALCDLLHRTLTDRDHHAALSAASLSRAATFSWQRTAALYADAMIEARQRFDNGRGIARSTSGRLASTVRGASQRPT